MHHKIKNSFNAFVQLFNLDKILLIPIIILCVINIIVQYSATDKDINRLINDSIYIFISLFVMLIIANLNLNHLKTIAKPLYIISIILLLGVMFFGISVNGARR
ncbi:MAG: FtsW/RodA/SpoVE family cell cycle protein, partial [Burkholderiales bacterium]|nr:FtsW/RodA/SpoVE family cell cycle protein [Burkholderiales bacterium]